jgi:hypothetical protein
VGKASYLVEYCDTPGILVSSGGWPHASEETNRNYGSCGCGSVHWNSTLVLCTPKEKVCGEFPGTLLVPGVHVGLKSTFNTQCYVMLPMGSGTGACGLISFFFS